MPRLSRNIIIRRREKWALHLKSKCICRNREIISQVFSDEADAAEKFPNFVTHLRYGKYGEAPLTAIASNVAHENIEERTASLS